MPRPLIVAPSILSSDFARLAQEAERMKECGADWLHIDVMDGHFVPNLTIGAPVVKALSKVTELPLDCHLMIDDPFKYAPDFLAAGAATITFHVEVDGDLRALCRSIRGGGARVGAALKPGTPADAVSPILDLLDMVLIMTVEPGFGGQSYMDAMAPKIQAVRAAIGDLPIDIQVDGGLSSETVSHAVNAGANVIVAGSAVFNADDSAAAIAALRSGAQV